MINNRQGGRRRGRGGQGGGQNLGGQPGNRQDNRQRGNAAQLLEKYKSMARDAQLAGDRVQTEYYLQFADHYFRVLSESRARFEEQNPRRQRDDDMDDDEGDEEMTRGREDEAADDADERQDRAERPGAHRALQPASDRPRRAGRRRRDSARCTAQPRRINGGGETIPFDVLPPAIGRDEAEAPKLRTKSRSGRAAARALRVPPKATTRSLRPPRRCLSR